MGILDDITAKVGGGSGGGILDRIAGLGNERQSEIGKGAKMTGQEVKSYSSNREAFESDDGDTLATLKRGAKKVVKTVMPYVRPVLEGGGAALGGILGAGGGGLAGLAGGPAAPATVPYGAIAGGVAGGATGYATGKYLADAIEGAPQSAPQTLADLRTGAMYEMGGQGLAAVGGKVLSAGANAYRKGATTLSRNTPALTKAAINRKAAETIAENTGQGAVYEKNAAEAAKVNIPGYKPSLGEARNDPALIKLQRGIEAQTGTAGNTIIEQRAANQTAVKEYLENEFKGDESIDDVVNALNQKKAQIAATTAQSERGAAGAKGALNPADSQTVGRGIADEIDDAVAPLKSAEREAWKKVPNYPIPSNNFDDAAEMLKNTPMVAETETAVKSILSYADRMPKTTEGLQSIERTINDKMFAPNADPNIKRVLGQLKKAIGDDFKAMGEAADAGDIALFEDKVVHPSKLKDELDNLTTRIAEGNVAKAAEPDIPAITTALRDAGDSPNLWMKQVNETGKTYGDRIAARYQQKIGSAPPMLKAEDSPLIKGWKDRQSQITNQLDNLQPADDVATAYRAAKDVSKERFDRFGKGVISDVTQSGNQASGRKLPDAMIPPKVFTPDGADDFIRAVGKDKAAAHADQYAAQDLLSKANPLTGEIPAKAVASWLNKNMVMLRKYGISGKYTTVAKAQAQAEIARAAEIDFTKSAASRILGSDVDKAIGSAFSSNPSNTGAVVDELLKQIGNDKQGVKGLQNAFKEFLVSKIETTAKTISGDSVISPAAMQKQLAKYAPAMRRLYATDPGKIAALKKVSNAIEIQARSAKTPAIGSSSTAENNNVARAMLGKVIGLVPGGNWTMQLGKIGLSKLNELNAAELNKVIVRALYDADFAQTLTLAAKRYKPQVVEKRINSHLVTMGLAAMTDEKSGESKD